MMNQPLTSQFDRIVRRSVMFVSVVAVVAALVGSIVHGQFWRTEEQRGDRLMSEGDFAAAAERYSDPMKLGVAQYRDGQFETAAKTFARVNSAEGLFNQGNAWLMNGKYDQAIASYDRALSMKADWIEAEENRTIALARKAVLDQSADLRTDQGTEIGADEIVFDEKGENKKGKDTELSEGVELSDEQLRAMWLRQVKTTPGEFLRAKFAYQVATQESTQAEEGAE